MLPLNFLSRTLSSTISRAPSIRFRFGASRDQKSAPASSTIITPASASGTAVPSGEPIYDFQLPQRWRRRPISEEEIAYINRGGPE